VPALEARTAPAPTGRQPVSLAGSFGPAALAAGLALVAVLMGWRGSDLPAHFFRVGLVERDGFEVWNNYWYGGHHTLGYGVAFPLLAAVVGIWTVAVASAAISAFVADRVIVAATGRRSLVASLWFAAGTMTNVLVGRLPFAVGMTIGLVALLAVARRRTWIAVLATVATSAASPVVSAFLAVIFVAGAIVDGRRRRFFAGLTAAAVAPVLAVTLLYPQGGRFPFRGSALVLTLVVCAAVWWLVPSTYRLVRAAAAVYAAASVLAFLVPSPLGANLTRLGMYAAAPVLLVCVPGRRLALTAALAVVTVWQWSPAVDAVARAGDDPSTERSYYTGLRWFLGNVDADTSARVEIVPTRQHWETAYVAVDYPIARGWERQLDRRFHALFYEPGLTAAEYRAWLADNGVGFVALSDAALDDSAVEEAALIESGLPYLRLVFRDDHWRVWEVVDSPGLLDGPAELVEMDTDSLRLRVLEPGDVVVRVRASAFWASDPALCIEPTADGWIVLRRVVPGELELFLDESNLVDLGELCDPGAR
jgi:hypothetical protein